jgi:hypothetical protein
MDVSGFHETIALHPHLSSFMYYEIYDKRDKKGSKQRAIIYKLRKNERG